ncbi:hypothetical protein ABKN59_011342 [Abortiporus biennis]
MKILLSKTRPEFRRIFSLTAGDGRPKLEQRSYPFFSLDHVVEYSSDLTAELYHPCEAHPVLVKEESRTKSVHISLRIQ